jgi:Uma2 family endonuclease
MSPDPLTLHHFTRAEYDRLVALDVFRGEAVELIGGLLVVAEPQGSYHASAVGTVGDALRARLPSGWLVRVQMPVALDDQSEPEPDVAVVPGDWADYRANHPTRPALVVEIAETSLAFDRNEKAGLYARGGVQDYWIVNLVDRVLEVFRDPEQDATTLHGWRYRTIERVGPAGRASLLSLPSVQVRVGDLLV